MVGTVRGWIAFTAFCFAVTSAAAAEPKRVLVLHSFGPQVAPWAFVDGHFREQLVKLSPNKIDLYDFYLQSNRFQHTDDDGRFLVNYLTSLFGARKLDLIVANGGPANSFAQKYRSQFFPSTPLVVAYERQLSVNYSIHTQNEAAIPVRLDFKNCIENILQVRPDTTHIAWVVGASPVERMWTEEFRRVSQPFADKISFEYSNDLRFDDLLARAASLPPHSALLYVGFLVDAAGVPLDTNVVLPRLREATNSPIFSYVDDFLGQGIVGGPMLSSKEVGLQMAKASVRILGGKMPLPFELLPIAPGPPQYDWRELQHWNISENQLPAGSIIHFREPTMWERYGWAIALICAALLLQGALISSLLFERRRRQVAVMLATKRAAELAHFNRQSIASELTTMMAHELNQPLAAIMTNAETARLMIKSPALDRDEKIEEILDDILRDDERAGKVIGRLRSLIKKSPFERSDNDLNVVARDATQLVARLAVARETVLNVQLASSKLRFKGDRVQVEQVMINLMVNAMDAMSAVPLGKREITISTRRVENFAETTVSDTGPGIPADEPEIVFQPFFTTKPDGMGMGLSISRNIVEAHGGQLWGENVASGGAIFHVRLPLAPTAG
jgi:signal transduction histidine kinase